MAALFFFVILGYLIGSVSPGYIFGRAVKKIDIREFGSKHTGAANTYRIVGPAYGIVAGVLDLLKTPFVYGLFISGLIFPETARMNPDWALLPGIATVVGHNYPLYLRFRGGRGVATLFGLSVAAVATNPDPASLLVLLWTVAYSIYISASLTLEWPLRKILKISALAFPIGLLWAPAFVGQVALWLFIGFLLLDVFRLCMPRLNQRYLAFKRLTKEKERKGFSGYTLFMASNFILLNFFRPEIATLVLISFILGDTLAPLGKSIFPIKMIGEKTLGGALIVISVSFISGLLLSAVARLSIPPIVVWLSPVMLAGLDQLSFFLDDNILAPVGTALLLNLIF